jgi:hypothetical protein
VLDFLGCLTKNIYLYSVKTNDMKYYTPHNKQYDLGLLKSSLDGLDKNNRWVMLGDLLPWSDIEKTYNSRLKNMDKGAGNKSARLIIGAMIVKHKLSLSDAETIETIRENPYMQYLCGLSEFTDKKIFNPTLFVVIRKRISEEEINEMTLKVLQQQQRILEDRINQKEAAKDEDKNDGDSQKAGTEDPYAKEFTDSKSRLHKGVLKIDATCADAEVRYPVDVDIVHDGCKVVDRYIKSICTSLSIKRLHTHYSFARRVYLTLIKKARKRGKMVKETIAQMLNYLRKDILLLVDIIAKDTNRLKLLTNREQNILTATIIMYHQQEEMLANNVHTCPNRIISIFQRHLRPIVRGKAKAKVEFGAKIGASIVDGYTFVDHHSWDAYNESQDLPLQIRLYQERFGYLPATILADKIYLNKENRKVIDDYEIKSYCKPLGRPPKEGQSEDNIRNMAKASGDRNEIESTFGVGKRIYRANNIRAKLPDTARCWTGMCYFIKNLMKFLRELCLVLLEIVAILKLYGLGVRPCGLPRQRALLIIQ